MGQINHSAVTFMDKVTNEITSGDPSVTLYTANSTVNYTTNGWIILNTSYSGITFTNDKIRSANFSGVPSGTVFNLTGSANPGYSFEKWKGSANSTKRSIDVTVDTNTIEVATFVPIQKFGVTFTESGLPSGTTWYVNITGQPSSGQ
ncbi:MAG: InlB B-repeat-containing protein [Thermoplasmataceae archaeon]